MTSMKLLAAVTALSLFPAQPRAADESAAQSAAATSPAAAVSSPAAAAEPAAKPAEAIALPALPEGGDRFTKDGVVIDFWVEHGAKERPLREGEFASVKFRLLDATSGLPLRSATPGAWMDIGSAGPDGIARECKEKVSTYMRGLVGIRPLIDLNSYYLLVLNQDASISVIDPIVGMTGKTNLYATILLERPGADWIRGKDDKKLYVSMPRAHRVAIVDGEAFKVAKSVDAGKNPVRVALQRDGRYLWVGNDAPAAADSGVTVIDTETQKAVASVRTGRGHHEIAFSADDRLAFVTNRDEGTVTVIDAATHKKVKDVKTGPLPISIATSSLSGAVYVADGKSGKISVLDPATGEVRKSMAAKPGLGPIQFTQDGRYGFVVNPAEHAAFVIDASDDRIVHTIAAGGQPYQIAVTRAFAYLRLLDSERVTMVNLAHLGRGEKPIVQSFPAGARAPKLVPDLSIASSMTQSAADAGLFIASPGDNSTYFYMEGMNAPMGSFAGYGHAVRAVSIVDRSLKEESPGVYAASVRIPEAGKYDVAVIMSAPRVVHCFGMEAQPDEKARAALGSTAIEYVDAPPRVAPGDRTLRFRIVDPSSHEAKRGLADVRVVHFLAPGRARAEVAAKEVGDGLYEAKLSLATPGAYYVHVGIPSLGVKPGDLPYHTVVVAAGPLGNAARAAASK